MTFRNLLLSRFSRAVILRAACLTLGRCPRAPTIFYAVGGIKVDATAASSGEAPTSAITQGRAKAWAKLYRRLTRQEDWPRQPQLDDHAGLLQADPRHRYRQRKAPLHHPLYLADDHL